MKRCDINNSIECAATKKRVRNEPTRKFELRLLISSIAAGAVIGRGGEYIKNLREKHEATFFIPDSSPERVLMAILDLYNVESCMQDMLVRLAEDSKDDDEIEIRMVVHQSHAGAIIGYNGENIFMLKNKMNAKLKVFKDCCPNSTDRVVLVTTTKKHMPTAIKVLAEFINVNQIKGVQKPYDAINYDPKLAHKYGGFIIAEVEAMKNRPKSSGSSDFASTSEEFFMNQPLMANKNSLNEAKHSAKIVIPSKYGGLIVGKGGTCINRIRAESTAKIDIDQADNELTSITICGDLSHMYKALFLMHQKIAQSGVTMHTSIKFDMDHLDLDHFHFRSNSQKG